MFSIKIFQFNLYKFSPLYFYLFCINFYSVAIFLYHYFCRKYDSWIQLVHELGALFLPFFKKVSFGDKILQCDFDLSFLF